MLAADQLGEIFALLLVIAPAADLVDAQVGVRAVAQADRGRRPRHFLLRDDMLEIAEAEPAPFLLDGDAVQAELAHLRPQMLRKFVLLVDLGGDRRDLVARRSAAVVSRMVSAISPRSKSRPGSDIAVSPVRSALARARRLGQAGSALCALHITPSCERSEASPDFAAR